jgi:hypothetical protein
MTITLVETRSMKRLSHFLLLALTAVLHAACAEPRDPAAPELDAGGAVLASSVQGGPDLSRLATFRTPPSITIAWAKQWIGPEGGRLEFHGFVIDVPAGAVDRTTQFSIRLPVDPNGSERVVAEFGPHAVTFAKPVSIELPYAGTSLEGSVDAATVLWWDAGVHDWVDMGASLTGDGLRIRTATGHFSLYGTGPVADRSGGVTVSGG